ncbi:MAG TPA: MBL fold metallo-hydrolase [Terracidiphilus sp.]|jgi:L-ascorbate metabolism protein UlaG (beta-lactamase superfamily)
MSYLVPARREGRRFLNPVPTEMGGLSVMLRIGPEFFLGSKARSPRQPLGPFHTDPRVYAEAPRTGLRITWLGHAASLIELDGVRILIDPVWEERASPTTWSGPKRFFEPTLPLEQLPRIDVVLISHDHYDHLGAQSMRLLSQVPAAREARWITPLGVGTILESMGVNRNRCTEVDWMDAVQAGPVTITALPARHFSGRSLFNRFQTLWASFALVGHTHRVYYGADSGEWPGFEEIGARLGPFDLVMLEIGASNPLWAQIHMGPEGAVRSFRALGGRGLLMPIHWGLFDLALHHWRQPIEYVSAVNDLKLWSPIPGQPSDLTKGEEFRSEWWRSAE